MDAQKIYEQFSKDKTEVKGNSIRKVAEFIFDNNYNPNFEEENKSELDCKDEKGILSCNVTKAHPGKKGEYHTYNNDSFGGDSFPQQ